MQEMLRAALLLGSLGMVSVAQATIYTVTDVLNGSSGFGASLFHNASGPDYMSGTTLETIPSVPVLSGTYNDVTGALNVTMNVNGGTGPFTLGGNLQFSGGTLGGNSQLDITFTAPSAPLVNDVLGFQPGYVCCGSTDQDPNSFIASGSDMIMTLWGANFLGSAFNGNYDSSTDLGMDLRLKMSAVPVPAAVWLFGSGLLGLVGVSRRRAMQKVL